MRVSLCLALALLFLLPGVPAAQDRIAYANVELILSLMPETQTARAGVDSLGRKLAKDLEIKEAYAQKKVEEARAAQAGGASEETLDKFRRELRGLEEEIRRDAEAADERLARHRSSLLKPLLEKLETTIRDVAKAEGYTFVLNSVDGDGNSIVLFGAEERDITKKVLTRMGIDVPKPEGAKAGAKKEGKSGKGK